MRFYNRYRGISEQTNSSNGFPVPYGPKQSCWVTVVCPQTFSEHTSALITTLRHKDEYDAKNVHPKQHQSTVRVSLNKPL